MIDGARLRGALLLLSLVLVLVAGQVQAAEREVSVTFLGVALDVETKNADDRLREYLRSHVDMRFDQSQVEYAEAFRTLEHWDAKGKGPLMARLTPYVYVVAEMLGADIEILATYRSRTTSRDTYNSYFVVHESFGYERDDLEDFVAHLRERDEPARFIFHNKFSTSSYFLPSLYFRTRGVFSVGASGGMADKFVAIKASRPSDIGGSSDLVRRVKRGEADFAAVWDGTKSKFDTDPTLRFIRLPNDLPNDLLVISKSADQEFKDRIVSAIDEMESDAIDIGDFLTWEDFDDTPAAREALASLRWMARERMRPVAVQIRRDPGAPEGVQQRHLEAARQAVRLSGTELVLYDEDFHSAHDVLWALSLAHDDSIVITSSYGAPDLDQKFRISFKAGDMESLTARVGSEIINKMHRIRYIWPFDDRKPRVLRDVFFEVTPGQEMMAQKITWFDFDRNEYSRGSPFDIEVKESGFHSFELESAGFPMRSGNQFDFDPMSNVAYRVYLVRAADTGMVFRVGAVALIALFSLAALADSMGRAEADLMEAAGRTRVDSSAFTRLLTNKGGLLLLLALLFAVNYAETQLEETAKGDSASPTGYVIARAFQDIEGGLSLEDHERVQSWVISGYTLSYFGVFPLLLLGTCITLGLRASVGPLRVFTVATAVNYLSSLPFFLFLPVPERWAYPGANAILLSDRLSTKLIESIRPISGLDNCFPSMHTSLTVTVVALAFYFGFRYRLAILCLGLTVILSTLVLGIHWIPDMAMGTAVGLLGVGVALLVERRFESEVPTEIEYPKPTPVPIAVAEPVPAPAVATAAVPPLAVQARGLADRIRGWRAGSGPAAQPGKVPDHGKGTLFISYRRETGSRTARLLQSELRARGYKSFLDVDDLGPRHFDDNLMTEIRRATNFLLILTPGSLDGCSNEGDWLRKEVAYALETNRNIVPVMVDGFTFPQRESLPPDIRDLIRHNAVSYSHEYFEATLIKLTRFLKPE